MIYVLYIDIPQQQSGVPLRAMVASSMEPSFARGASSDGIPKGRWLKTSSSIITIYKDES